MKDYGENQYFNEFFGEFLWHSQFFIVNFAFRFNVESFTCGANINFVNLRIIFRLLLYALLK